MNQSEQPKSEETALKIVIKKNPRNFFSNSIITFFNWYGRLLATHPLKSVCLCLIIPALSAIGLRDYKTENNPYKLWIPQNSDYLRNHEWLWTNFPPDIRYNSIILSSEENILTPDTLKTLLHIHKAVANTTSSDGFQWKDVCYKVPFIDLGPISELLGDDYDYDDYDEDYDEDNDERKKRKRRSSAEDLGFDPSIDLYPGDYCNIIHDLTEHKCLENSLLELWSEDNYGEDTEQLLQTITQEEIIRAVNEDTFSKELGFDQDFAKYLGGVERNSTGHIVSAKATFMRFFGKVNLTAITEEELSRARLGSPVDGFTLRWETSLIETLTAGLGDLKGYELFTNVAKSFTDLSSEAIEGDAFFFGCGTAIMFTYVQIMLGKFNLVEQRPGLSSVGLACCFLGLVTSYGICSGLGLVFSPMHAIIPFLFVGIGIDDMFVIVQCHSNIINSEEGKTMSHKDIMGMTMKQAGVAITITSITNIIVFAVGAVTVLPALQSFCVYCAVGITGIYIYQATIFAALLGIDQKRIDGRRNGLLPCIKHKDWTPNSVSQMNLGQKFFTWYGGLLTHWAAKVVVILVTVGLASGGVWGLTLLRQEFNPVWFIPPESYLAKWFAANEFYFPKEGETVKINIAQVDFNEELPKIEALVARLEEETEILSNVDSWYSKFKEYTEKNNLVEGSDLFEAFKKDKAKFYTILTQFLFSPSGAKYRGNFNFMNKLVCGEAASDVLVTFLVINIQKMFPLLQLSSIELTHKLFSGPSEWIPAMNKVKQIVAEANFSNRAFPVGREYASWETDEVIELEFWRNMGLSLLCVFLTTLVLIQNLPACIIVLVCVLLTLVNVGGFIHFWGLTIDTVSCINLIIAVGLCVDYSAHIAHNFMEQTGSSDLRAVQTMRDIGPAVLNGGFSTFLAFVLTAGSTSHVFSTFFKIFFLVALFGMFHALVFLPVCLSLCGKLLKPQSETSASGVIQISNNPNLGVDNKIFTLDNEDLSKEKKITLTNFKMYPSEE